MTEREHLVELMKATGERYGWDTRVQFVFPVAWAGYTQEAEQVWDDLCGGSGTLRIAYDNKRPNTIFGIPIRYAACSVPRLERTPAGKPVFPNIT